MNKKIRLTEKFSEFMILLVIFVSVLILAVLSYFLADENVDGLSSGLVILVANSIAVCLLLFIKIKEMEMRWEYEKD